MKRSASLEKVNGADAEAVSNARKPPRALHTCNCSNVSKRRLRSAVGNVLEQYSISIKPKLSRSSSLCDLTNTSEFNLDIIKISQHKNRRKQKFPFHDRSGDAVEKYVNELTENPYMSCGSRGKKSKKKDTMMSETYGSKFASDYINNLPSEALEINFSSVENSSTSSTNQTNGSAQKGAAFPFKSTPSGNLKVQSNQVVFQSSTVGVILADPTQAKVKVKFEGQAAGEPDDFISQNYDNDTENELRLQYGTRDVDDSKLEVDNSNYQVKNSNFHGRLKTKSPGVREDKGKDLSSLGYAVPEPIDWMRVQLPKKQDLFQEFFRRIHNYMHIVSITRRFTNSAPAAVDCIMAEFVSRNTDTVVRIGDEEFHCHRIVLQIYSSFFEMNPQREIELQTTNVTPEAFQSVYIWMIFSAQESIRSLKRENVLDLFCAAQYLAIKDLEEQCWSLIVNENLFTEDTAFALFREARQKGMTHVMDIMVPRVMRFFLPLVASTNFLTLEPEEILIFLKSNFISVTSEIEVLMSGVRWLYGDWSSRRRYAVEVMRCIRFGLISPWQLVDIKRNPDNNEVLEIVNDPEVQQMVDDGLAFVIIKYWYGNNSKNYYHWIDVLGLTEPAERNWIGEEKNHVTYKDFLKYLEQFMVPREQMYQQMAMMQTARRSDDIPGSMRGIDSEKMEMRRPKMDFPLPATLKGLTVDKDKSFPTMSEFFENQKRNQECKPFPPPCRSPPVEMDRSNVSPPVRRRSPCGQHQKQFEEHKCQQELKQNTQQCKIHQIHMCSVEPQSVQSKQDMFEPPEKDSEETTTLSETSSCTVDEKNLIGNFFQSKSSEKRHSVAASYLAAATAALAGTRRTPSPTNGIRSQNAAAPPPRAENAPTGVAEQPQTSNIFSPQISMFNNSKESLARVNKNKLSYSILGPSNKNYILDGSLFNWDRETVLVFGGIDPHTSYGVGSNTGKDIFRFEPVTNLWENVGELPEPRHHHSVAFLRGRVYLVGGADPRDDDIRGKSVVVSTVWSYEPVSRSWYSESGLAVPRKNFGLVVHRMALYAIGGQDKRGRVLRSVEKFDPKTAAWTEVRSMGVARMAVAVTKYREYIWVAGGMTGEKKKPVCKIVECYNSNTNHASGMFAEMRVDCFYSTMRKRGTSLVRRVPTSSNTIINVFANRWTEIHSLRFPRCFATLFAMNDKLFIIGGAGKVSDKDKTASSVGAIDVWDWQSRQWKHETDMSMPRHGHALAYLGTQLIIIGGVTTIYMRALNNVESFCCERGAWIRGVATLPTPLSGHGAVTLPPASLM